MIFYSCSKQIAGGSSDTELIGCIKDSLNKPIEGAIITLYQNDYNPVDDSSIQIMLIDTSDINGNFSFKLKSGGTYNLVAQKGNYSFMEDNVVVNLDSLLFIELQDIVLLKSGTFKVVLPTVSRKATEGYVHIKGTNLYTSFVFGDDTATINSVPANTPLKVYGTNAYDLNDFLIDSTSTVLPNDTSIVCNSVNVLCIIDTSVTVSPSFDLALALKDQFTSINIKSIHLFSPDDTMGMDVIYFGSDVDSLYGHDDLFNNSHISLVVSSSDLYPHLNMTDSFGTEDVTNMAIAEVSGTLPGTTQKFDAITLFDSDMPAPVVEWGIPNSWALNIGKSSGAVSDRSYFFVYDTYAELTNGESPANYRVGVVGCNTHELNDTGKQLIWRILHWMKEESQYY